MTADVPGTDPVRLAEPARDDVDEQPDEHLAAEPPATKPSAAKSLAAQADDDGRLSTQESTNKARRWGWGRVRRIIKWLLAAAVVGCAAGALYHELSTSTWQAAIFSDIATAADFHLGDGPADAASLPTDGPYDRRLGYTRIDDMVDRLSRRGFRVTRQARLNDQSQRIVDQGLSLPYDAPTQAGLGLVDPSQNVVHRAMYPQRVYTSFDQIPSLLVDTLLHIENRSLLDPDVPRFNPALEWRRFGLALGEVAWREVGGDVDPDGASTLATQIQKYRHSPGGQTRSYTDKFHQMLSASLMAYRRGQRTLSAQRDIIQTYVNSVPLSAVVGLGEVRGIGDGLFGWYGVDFDRANRLLRQAAAGGTAADADVDPDAAAAQARVFRRVLSLLVAQRRPSYYLVAPDGRKRLDEMVDFYLGDLARSDIISPGFRDLALRASTGPWRRRIDTDKGPFWPKKLAHSLRVGLLELTGAPTLYALDRYDLTAQTTVDQDVEHAVETTLQHLSEPAFLHTQGLDAYRLLDRGDPADVIYSVTVYERTAHANKLRVQADTLDTAFNINRGMKLNLGSTAKLRTLTTYLDVVATLHDELTALSPADLAGLDVHWSNHLKVWAVDWVGEHPDAADHLQAMLDAAMDRRYSANPTQRFFTGGGIQHFTNFSHKYDQTSPTVRFGLEHSINLVFVRMMRDIVRFYMFRQPGVDAKVLADANDPRRRRYLERFADYEGKVFLHDFYRRYDDHTARQRLVVFLDRRDWTPKRFVTALRAVRPEMDVYTLRSLLNQQLERDYPLKRVRRWYQAWGPERFDLNDQGYVSGVHPLELWLMGYLDGHPDASWTQASQASKDVRQTVYQWLFKTSRKHAQDQRIRIMMEQDAFEPIHREWVRMGYPFDELVPSYATAIGSSSDRPQALARLMGILVNNGLRMPEVRYTRLRFGADTPFETRMRRAPGAPKRVLPAAVAQTVRRAVNGVVQHGTGHRLTNYDLTVDGHALTAGGKTGTGDNRYKITDRHGRVQRSIARNRTATFVFHLGARFFGAVTAYVPGEQADEYDFTSGLAVSVLGLLVPKLAPLWQQRDTPDQRPMNAATASRKSSKRSNRSSIWSP